MADTCSKQFLGGQKIVQFKSLDKSVQELINEALSARKLSYSPYSKFPVGAALQCISGTVYSGCNVENSSYGLSICAERTALVKAISSGEKTFKSIAVVANHENSSFVAPCGACRQFLIEFGLEIEIYLSKPDKSEVLITSASEILPLSFHLLN